MRNGYEFITVPAGIRRDVHFDKYECYGIATGKCSLVGWDASENIEDKMYVSENHVNYCRILAKRIHAYDVLINSYSHKIKNMELQLEDYEGIKQILLNYVNRYKKIWCEDNEFTNDIETINNFIICDAKEFIKGWEEDTTIRIHIRACGHISFTDGRHRSCIADRLGVPIKAYMSRIELTCNDCYYVKKNKWYWLLKLANRLNGINKIPL